MPLVVPAVASDVTLLATLTDVPRPLASDISLDDVTREVVALVVQVSGKPTQVALEAELLADLGFDSLRVLELVGELEDRFRIAVPLNTLTHIKTVGQIAAEVQRLIVDRESAG